MQQEDVSDLIGDTSTPPAAAAKPAVKPKPKLGAAVPAPKAAVAKPAAKPAAAAKPATAPKPKLVPKKPAAKPIAAKKKAVKNGAKAARGGGKFYFAPEERDALAKVLRQRVKGAVTTKDLAEKLGQPTWKIRMAAKTLVAAKLMKWKKEGATLVLSV